MPFHKTYEEFLDQMEAVKSCKEVIPDDFFLSIVLPLAYKHTMLRIANNYPGEGRVRRAQEFWNDICKTKYFDPHFSWAAAERDLTEMYPGGGWGFMNLLSDLRNACARSTAMDYAGRAMHEFGKLFPKHYA